MDPHNKLSNQQEYITAMFDLADERLGQEHVQNQMLAFEAAHGAYLNGQSSLTFQPSDGLVQIGGLPNQLLDVSEGMQSKNEHYLVHVAVRSNSHEMKLHHDMLGKADILQCLYANILPTQRHFTTFKTERIPQGDRFIYSVTMTEYPRSMIRRTTTPIVKNYIIADGTVFLREGETNGATPNDIMLYLRALNASNDAVTNRYGYTTTSSEYPFPQNDSLAFFQLFGVQPGMPQKEFHSRLDDAFIRMTNNLRQNVQRAENLGENSAAFTLQLGQIKHAYLLLKGDASRQLYEGLGADVSRFRTDTTYRTQISDILMAAIDPELYDGLG